MRMSKQGVILLNLGSPDSTQVSDVRKYLREFLMDERVLDAPFAIRWFLVNCLILPNRPKQSAEAYSQIWLEDGSPLILTSKAQQKALSEQEGKLPSYARLVPTLKQRFMETWLQKNYVAVLRDAVCAVKQKGSFDN